MATERLRAELKRLRAAIAAMDGSDRESLERLEQIAGDVEAELERESTVTDPAGLIEELEDSVSAFEGAHPNLAALVNNLVNVLASMGV